MQLDPGTHTFPQNPQLTGSAPRLVHLPKQLAWPGRHMTGLHWPWLQNDPGPQVTPHPPQLAGLFARSTHWAPHRAGRWPRQLHLPEMHCSPLRHASPQAPQLRASPGRFTQAPLQLVSGAGHTVVQTL